MLRQSPSRQQGHMRNPGRTINDDCNWYSLMDAIPEHPSSLLSVSLCSWRSFNKFLPGTLDTLVVGQSADTNAAVLINVAKSAQRRMVRALEQTLINERCFCCQRVYEMVE